MKEVRSGDNERGSEVSWGIIRISGQKCIFSLEMHMCAQNFASAVVIAASNRFHRPLLRFRKVQIRFTVNSLRFSLWAIASNTAFFFVNFVRRIWILLDSVITLIIPRRRNHSVARMGIFGRFRRRFIATVRKSHTIWHTRCAFSRGKGGRYWNKATRIYG